VDSGIDTIEDTAEDVSYDFDPETTSGGLVVDPSTAPSTVEGTFWEHNSVEMGITNFGGFDVSVESSTGCLVFNPGHLWVILRNLTCTPTMVEVDIDVLGGRTFSQAQGAGVGENLGEEETTTVGMDTHVHYYDGTEIGAVHVISENGKVCEIRIW
jgi:hypothetical protein